MLHATYKDLSRTTNSPVSIKTRRTYTLVRQIRTDLGTFGIFRAVQVFTILAFIWQHAFCCSLKSFFAVTSCAFSCVVSPPNSANSFTFSKFPLRVERTIWKSKRKEITRDFEKRKTITNIIKNKFVSILIQLTRRNFVTFVYLSWMFS